MPALISIPYFQVDAFTDRLFGGNPAGVCILDRWLPDELLQFVAAENNLSETAFLVEKGGGFDLRWFTPALEVDLCGHATLAAAFVLFTEQRFTEKRHAGRHIEFYTRSKETLRSEWDGRIVMLDFPSSPGRPCEVSDALMEGLRLGGKRPLEVLRSRDCMAVLDSEDAVRKLKPDFERLLDVDTDLGVIATAKGSHSVDFVSRFFEPKAGVDEDPVTGSAHCTLIPYWAEKLSKPNMIAHQLFPSRGGIIHCEMRGERVGIGGHAVLYSRGELRLPDRFNRQ